MIEPISAVSISIGMAFNALGLALNGISGIVEKTENYRTCNRQLNQLQRDLGHCSSDLDKWERLWSWKDDDGKHDDEFESLWTKEGLRDVKTIYKDMEGISKEILEYLDCPKPGNTARGRKRVLKFSIPVKAKKVGGNIYRMEFL
jgi:hypothetical protein